MKRSKLFAITLQSKSGLIFFFILAAYNLLLGVYLKDFFVLSPMLMTLYLLSALPTLFFVLKIRSTPMRVVVLIVLFLVMVMSIVSALSCRRLLPMLMFVVTAIEMMYFGIVDNSSGKDKLLTKIYVLAVSVCIIVALILSYNFVYKPEAPYLSNGRDTLWDTQTEELADEICAGCETDEEKVRVFYDWIITNFEYDYDCYPLFQYFDVRKTLRTKQGICFDFAHLFAAFCRSQNIPCYAVDGISRKNNVDRHTWNRVYYDGTWWNVDITTDNSRTANGKELYGFHKLEGAFVPDEDFFITKIY
ncbi:MAG: transglutaminase domain-containing protein [Oscillospiraceae bacterium]|nr:transglutaminase domain-containing protein [Oscillospiraceae bacterium]